MLIFPNGFYCWLFPTNSCISWQSNFPWPTLKLVLTLSWVGWCKLSWCSLLTVHSSRWDSSDVPVGPLSLLINSQSPKDIFYPWQEAKFQQKLAAYLRIMDTIAWQLASVQECFRRITAMKTVPTARRLLKTKLVARNSSVLMHSQILSASFILIHNVIIQSYKKLNTTNYRTSKCIQK